MTDLLALDNQLCFALYNASRAIVRAYTPLLEPLGLTYPQYAVMLALWETDDVPVSQLGRRMGLDSATLTPLLKRLEQRGVVARRRDDEDERVVRITLTREGTALRNKARSIPRQLVACAGVPDDCSLDELHKLREDLTALTSRLEQAEKARTS